MRFLVEALGSVQFFFIILFFIVFSLEDYFVEKLPNSVSSVDFLNFSGSIDFTLVLFADVGSEF
jgi:NADH:ubiquinone oxidoreductase subunit 3 (subunit A)